MLKTLLLFCNIIFLSTSSFAGFYSKIINENQLEGMNCKMVVYVIMNDNNTTQTTDDVIVGTYSAAVGAGCTDFKQSGDAVKITSIIQPSSLYLTTTVRENITEKNKNSLTSTHLISTHFFDDNGTPLDSSDDKKIGVENVLVSF